MQEEIISLLFPTPLFFQSLNSFRRCWSSFLGFRFAHCQQDMSKLLDWMEKPLFPESLGIVSAFWGMDYSGDCRSISGICRKGNPHCGGRCHSNAYPSHLNWSTFQTFPGWIQFLGVLYKKINISLVCAGFNLEFRAKKNHEYCPALSVATTMVQTHMGTTLFSTWKVRREMGWGLWSWGGLWSSQVLCARTWSGWDPESDSLQRTWNSWRHASPPPLPLKHPWSQDADCNDSVVCLAVADLVFLERININTFFCISLFFSLTHCSASYFTVCSLSPAPKETVIPNSQCCPACYKTAQCET